MKKLLATLLISTTLGAVFAQNPSSAAVNYHAYRTTPTLPSYGLRRVESLIKTIKPDGDGGDSLPARAYGSLSLPEKFTYTMIHGEQASQNCNAMPTIEGENKKIFAYPPSAFGESDGLQVTWSDKQVAFLHKNRSAVIGLLRSTIRQKDRVGVNLKQAIIEIDAFELIPDLVRVYGQTKKDQDIISVLMILMKQGKFQPFLSSSTYRKLYGDNADYQSYDVANSANEKLMIARAMAYYKSRMG